MAPRKRVDDAPTPQADGRDTADYRPREFGRITWLIKLAEREVGKELDRELRHSGLTKSQFGVLQALMHLERASSAALARTVFVTPQAMVGIVAGLERKGFIRRKTSRASARVIEATVTAAGRVAYDEGVRHDPQGRRHARRRVHRRRAGRPQRLPGADDQRRPASQRQLPLTPAAARQRRNVAKPCWS